MSTSTACSAAGARDSRSRSRPTISRSTCDLAIRASAVPGVSPLASYDDRAMTLYVPEDFTREEADVLRRYFTNLDGPVFALVNLPEVVKGALFARYSRSPKSLRRL